MIYVTTYTLRPENRDAALDRFRATAGAPPAGVKMIGRWHDVCGGKGYTVSESDDPQAVLRWVLAWSDLLSFEVSAVVNDEQFAKAIGA